MVLILFYFFEKIRKTLNLKKQEQFLKNTKMMFSMFSTTILNNSFQRYEPNRLSEPFRSCSLKLFYVLKNKENEKNIYNKFDSQFFIVKKNTKNIDNIKSREQYRTLFWMVFSKNCS